VSRHARNLCVFLSSLVVSLAGFFFLFAASSSPSFAQTAGSNAWGSWAYENFGGQSRAVLTPAGGGASTYVPLGSSSVGTLSAAGGGGVTASMPITATLSSAGKPSVSAVLTAQRVATAQRIAQGALTGLLRGPSALPTAALLLAPAAVQWANDQWSKPQIVGVADLVVTGAPYLDSSSCSRLAVGQCGVNFTGANNAYGKFCRVDGTAGLAGWNTINYCSGTSSLVTKVFPAPYSQPTELVPASAEDVQTALEQGLAASPASAPGVAQEVIDSGGTIEASEPLLSGPVSVTSPTTTKTTSSGSVSSSTTYNITYNNNSVGYSTTTVTTSKDAAGNVTGTETETSEPTPEDIQTTASDPSMPALPVLYTQKYPDGLSGVWSEKSSQLNETGYGAALDAMLPDIPDGGGCPQFSIPGGNLSGFSFGGGSIGPPCYVWPWIKAIVIISSLFLARSLIFGG